MDEIKNNEDSIASTSLSSASPSGGLDLTAALMQLKELMSSVASSDIPTIPNPMLVERLETSNTASEMRKCMDKLKMLNQRLDGLMDMSEISDEEIPDNGNEDGTKSSDDATVSEDEVELMELSNDEERKLMEHSVFVTESDFIRISNALNGSDTVEEWIGHIKSITGCDSVDRNSHIAETHPTEHTISELFELHKSKTA